MPLLFENDVIYLNPKIEITNLAPPLTLVYNNFPFPTVSDKKPIEKLAQAILDAREIEFKKDPKTSLADLYDPDFMPPTLRKAHQKLDKAVDKLYQKEGFQTPLERVKHLFELYQDKK